MDDHQSCAFHDELHGRVLETYHGTRKKRKAVSRYPVVRRLLSRKLALAASILIVAGAAIWTLMSVPGPLASVSFAAVLGEIRKVRPVTYTVSIQEEDSTPYKMQWMISASGRARWIRSDGAVNIRDFTQGKLIRLDPVERTFRILTRPTRTRPLGERRYDPLKRIRNLRETDGRFAGTEQLDGRSANVFRIQRQDQTMTIWADIRTNLPIRVEIVATLKTATLPSRNRSTIISDFVWDADLPESLFALTPPEGYIPEWQRGEAPTEADLIELLRLLASMSEGIFPPSLDPSDIRRMAVRYLRNKGLVVGATVGDLSVTTFLDDPNDLVETTQGIVKRGIKFVDRQEGTKSDWCYRGGGIKLGDANTPICWWKPEGSTMYRVVYGDLTIRDATPDELPQRSEVPETQTSTSEEEEDE